LFALRRHVVEEYERTISDLVTGRERQRVLADIEREKLQHNCNLAKSDLDSSRRALQDVNRWEKIIKKFGRFNLNESSIL